MCASCQQTRSRSEDCRRRSPAFGSVQGRLGHTCNFKIGSPAFRVPLQAPPFSNPLYLFYHMSLQKVSDFMDWRPNAQWAGRPHHQTPAVRVEPEQSQPLCEKRTYWNAFNPDSEDFSSATMPSARRLPQSIALWSHTLWL